jgi:hypothetical protein
MPEPSRESGFLGAVSRLLPQNKPPYGTKRPSIILLMKGHFVPLRASTEGVFQRSLLSRHLCPDPGKAKKPKGKFRG